MMPKEQIIDMLELYRCLRSQLDRESINKYDSIEEFNNSSNFSSLMYVSGAIAVIENIIFNNIPGQEEIGNL